MLAFGTYSLWVLAQVGLLGIWAGGFANPVGTQITLDLVVARTLLVGYIARVGPQPAVVAGSFGPLAYLLWPRAMAPGP